MEPPQKRARLMTGGKEDMPSGIFKPRPEGEMARLPGATTVGNATATAEETKEIEKGEIMPVKEHDYEPIYATGRTFTDMMQEDCANPSQRGGIYVLVGKGRKGKSHFMRYLIMDKVFNGQPKLEYVTVFQKSKFEKDYDFVDDDQIYDGYQEEVLKQMDANLEAMAASGQPIPSNAVVFDDLVGILSNQTTWFTNWIARTRHTNTHVFIAVQYLTGRGAITPIMREQTTAAIMFNSKTTATIENLFDSYGQLFENKHAFQDYFHKVTNAKDNGPFVAMVYLEREDDLEHNYIPVRVPKEFPIKKL